MVTNADCLKPLSFLPPPFTPSDNEKSTKLRQVKFFYLQCECGLRYTFVAVWKSVSYIAEYEKPISALWEHFYAASKSKGQITTEPTT